MLLFKKKYFSYLYSFFLVLVFFFNEFSTNKALSKNFNITEIKINEEYDLNFEKSKVIDRAFEKAFKRTRNNMGPSLIVSNVVRLLPHSSSDDHTKYRSKKELDQDKKRDPLILFKEDCIDNKIIKSHYVLSGADYNHTEKLLPKSLRQYSPNYWSKKTLAPSSLLFYLGFDKKLKNLAHHNLFF